MPLIWTPNWLILIVSETLKSLASVHKICKFFWSLLYTQRYQFLNSIGTNYPVKISGITPAAPLYDHTPQPSPHFGRTTTTNQCPYVQASSGCPVTHCWPCVCPSLAAQPPRWSHHCGRLWSPVGCCRGHVGALACPWATCGPMRANAPSGSPTWAHYHPHAAQHTYFFC